MALPREIEKLQRRWQENPLGLTFAPLAEAYRKEGAPADALELLAIGLAQHPNYVPAHIVRGRCFLDARDDHAAESAFLRVAELDPENVIALKALAEIAERGGRFSDAMARLDLLLEVDRANDEAREQWDRLRATIAIPGLGREASPTPEVVAAFFQRGPASAPEAEAPEPTREPMEPIFPVEPVAAAEEIVAAVREDVEVILYHPVELSPSGEHEYQRGSDSDDLRPGAARGGRADPFDPVEDLVPSAAIPPTAEAEPPEPEAGSVDADDAEAMAGVEAEPELVVTETMAELFLRQGHKELALAVYSQLGARDPDQPRIRAAIEQLQSEVKREAPSLPVYAAVLTGGPSVRGFFEQLLAAIRPAATGAPTDPGLSLGAVFGDDTAGGRPAAATDSGPSFDEFYGGDPVMEATAPVVASDPGEEAVAADLESFTSWLKGLKR